MSDYIRGVIDTLNMLYYAGEHKQVHHNLITTLLLAGNKTINANSLGRCIVFCMETKRFKLENE